MMTNIGQRASGRWLWQIVDRRGRIVRQARAWRPNLLLNIGMDHVATASWCNCFTHASAGSGTTPNYVSSGGVTASQSGTTVTASAPIFSAADVNKNLFWPQAPTRQAFITGYTSATQVTVRETQTVTSGVFYVVNSKQTGLVTELKRTGAYVTGIANCFTTRTGDVLTHRRTYLFSAEVGDVDYNEFGLAWAISGANTHFARFTTDEPITILTGNQLRLVYELRLTLFPTSPRYVETNVVAGWPYTPSPQSKYYDGLQYVGMSSINSGSGATQYFDSGYYTNEPSANGGANVWHWISSDSTALTSFGSSIPRSGGAVISTAPSYSTYNPLDFYRDRTIIISAGAGDLTNIRSLGFGDASAGAFAEYNNHGYAQVYDWNQRKPNTDSLTLTYRYAWSRIIVI